MAGGGIKGLRALSTASPEVAECLKKLPLLIHSVCLHFKIFHSLKMQVQHQLLFNIIIRS